MIKKVLFIFVVLYFITIVFTIQDSSAININEEDKLILVGIGAFKDGFYDIAEKQFSLFLRDYSHYPKTHEISYLLAKTFIMKGKFGEAKTVLLKIVNENKTFSYLDYTLFWLGIIEMKLGNEGEAKTYFLLLTKKFPKFEWIHFCYYLLGSLDIVSNQLTTAEASFKKASQTSKQQETIRSSFFWLGVLSYKKGDYDAAVSYFQGLWEDPKAIPEEYLKYAFIWLGEAQLKLGRFVDAKNNFKTFYEQFKNDPLIPMVYGRLGFCEYRLGNLKSSIEIFQSFKNQFKDSSLMLFTHYILGKLLLDTGDFTSSIKELNLILNKPKENRFLGVSCLALFWDYIHLGDMEGANKILQRLQKLNQFEEDKTLIQWLNAEWVFVEGRIMDSLPYYFNVINTRFREKALFQIGKGYFFETKLREAITNLDILILEFPNSEYFQEGLLIKGECLIKLGNLDQALETGDLIIKQKQVNLWHLFALTQGGHIYLSRNDPDRAEDLFRKVIDTFPNHPLSYYVAFQLGNLYFKKNYLAEAISYYSSVLKGNNTHELLGQVSLSIGEIFVKQGKFEKALTSFETAINYHKETSLGFFLAQMEIGNLQKKLGKYDEAKKAYKIILDNSMDEELKKAAKELLNLIDS
jgi:TolA-binding protein